MERSDAGAAEKHQQGEPGEIGRQTVRRNENSSHGRKGRLDARVAATPLERVHESRLFTADVGAGAAMDVHVHRLPTPHRVFADDACRVCFLDRSLHALDGLGELATDVDVRRLRANGVRADPAPAK